MRTVIVHIIRTQKEYCYLNHTSLNLKNEFHFSVLTASSNINRVILQPTDLDFDEVPPSKLSFQAISMSRFWPHTNKIIVSVGL